MDVLTRTTFSGIIAVRGRPVVFFGADPVYLKFDNHSLIVFASGTLSHRPSSNRI